MIHCQARDWAPVMVVPAMTGLGHPRVKSKDMISEKHPTSCAVQQVTPNLGVTAHFFFMGSVSAQFKPNDPESQPNDTLFSQLEQADVVMLELVNQNKWSAWHGITSLGHNQRLLTSLVDVGASQPSGVLCQCSPQ